MLGYFVDVGSTFTKVRLLDLDSGELIDASQSPTTIEDDVMIGLDDALGGVEERTGIGREDADVRLVSSSAAGGLRMVIVGFSPKYTLAAGQRAALGAGAKIVDSYTWYLAEDDLASIRRSDPDLLLLTGGTDGGNERALKKNAELLATLERTPPVIVAGNEDVRPDAAKVLEAAGFDVTFAENVLASGEGDLNVRDVRSRIQQTFLSHIVDAKGLGNVREFADDEILPTPDAISRACELVSTGSENGSGFGELLAVDVGGATTDVHSIGHGDPTEAYVRRAEKLEEPFRKRTVEGDLGIRFNAPTIRARYGTDAIVAHLPERVDTGDVERYIETISTQTDWIPQSDREYAFDMALASVATAVAARRHAGTLERVGSGTRETFAGAGEAGEITSDAVSAMDQSGKQDRLPTKYEQVGKDLTEFSTVVGTGGVLVNARRPHAILGNVERADDDADVLLPQAPSYYLDEHYLLFACGLMAETYPESALRTAERNLRALS